MSPEEAKILYEKEWPELNKVKEAAIKRGDSKGSKRARQALNNLSIKYRERFKLYSEYRVPTISERLEALEERVDAIELLQRKT